MDDVYSLVSQQREWKICTLGGNEWIGDEVNKDGATHARTQTSTETVRRYVLKYNLVVSFCPFCPVDFLSLFLCVRAYERRAFNQTPFADAHRTLTAPHA